MVADVRAPGVALVVAQRAFLDGRDGEGELRGPALQVGVAFALRRVGFAVLDPSGVDPECRVAVGAVVRGLVGVGVPGATQFWLNVIRHSAPALR